MSEAQQIVKRLGGEREAKRLAAVIERARDLQQRIRQVKPAKWKSGDPLPELRVLADKCAHCESLNVVTRSSQGQRYATRQVCRIECKDCRRPTRLVREAW